MTDNFNTVFETRPIQGRKFYRYERAIDELVKRFACKYPEYSEDTLKTAALADLSGRTLYFKPVSLFRRVFCGWKDAVRLDFGVDERLDGTYHWYCRPTHGSIQSGKKTCFKLFVPDGKTYDDSYEEVKEELLKLEKLYRKISTEIRGKIILTVGEKL